MSDPTPLALVRPKTPTSGNGKSPATPESWRTEIATLEAAIAEAKRDARQAVQALGRPDPSDHQALMAWRIAVAQSHPEETARLQAMYRAIDRDEANLAELRARLARIENPAPQLVKCGVLREHASATLAQFPLYADRIRGWLDAPEESARTRCLLINGPVGTGKSHLAAAVLAEVICRDTLALDPARMLAHHTETHAKFLLARSLLNALWSDGAGSGSVAMLRLTDALSWLVIDDLGHEGRVSEGALGAFHELLSIRCGNYQRTILTTNLSVEEIERAYDASIASRLAGWTQIVLTGADRRRA